MSTMTLEERRKTLVNALRAGKGWMTGYAEAFVDQYSLDAHITPPTPSPAKAQAVDGGRFLDALDEACRNNDGRSVHWINYTRDQRLAVVARALSGEKAVIVGDDLLPRLKIACRALVRERKVYAEDLETLSDVVRLLESISGAEAWLAGDSTPERRLFDLAREWGDNKVNSYQLMGRIESIVADVRALSGEKAGRVFTYENQPGNVAASRMGGACRNAQPGGDSIDHGLSLLKELQACGFGIVSLDPSSPEGIHPASPTPEEERSNPELSGRGTRSARM